MSCNCGRALLCLLFVTGLVDAETDRYQELRRAVDRNTGFAHMTRGVNAYTLYALRSCVTESDIPTLRDMLKDKDRIVRMATSSVLADLGEPGRSVVRLRIAEAKDSAEKSMLKEALDGVANPDYRPILQYPLRDDERARIRGCH